MKNKPAYYRARLKAFRELIREEVQTNPDNDSLDLRVLRNGVLPGKGQAKFDQLISQNQKDQGNNKLRFDEITHFNTWFEIHPEKIAGTEIITSSREFPIMIKGTEQDIIQTVIPSQVPDKKENRIRLLKPKPWPGKEV